MRNSVSWRRAWGRKPQRLPPQEGQGGGEALGPQGEEKKGGHGASQEDGEEAEGYLPLHPEKPQEAGPGPQDQVAQGGWKSSVRKA